MKFFTLFAFVIALAASCARPSGDGQPGTVTVRPGPRPDRFPARIWGSCDFELRAKDAVWGGRAESENIMRYPSNRTAGAARPDGEGGVRISVAWPSYPRASGNDRVYFRYLLAGASDVTLSLYSLDRQDSYRLRLTGMTGGAWSEAVADFSGVGSGSGGDPIAAGERILEVEFTARSEQGKICELIVDDVICFEPAGREAAREEPFPRRVIKLWSFDPLEYYHPWTHTDFRIVQQGEGLPNDWGVASSLPAERGGMERIRLIIDPPQAVGEVTRLRFDYRLKNVSRLQPMIFDLTDRDNRHVLMENQVQGRWQTVAVDFTARGIRNDGNQTPFRAGNRVDDVFFLVWPAEGADDPELLIDNVVLYDAGG